MRHCSFVGRSSTIASSYYHRYVVPLPEPTSPRCSMVYELPSWVDEWPGAASTLVTPLLFLMHDTSRTSSVTSREPGPFGHRSRGHLSKRDPPRVSRRLLRLHAAQVRRVVRAN